MFSVLSKREIIILATLNLSSANAFSLVKSKIVLCGKELKGTKIVGKGENAGNPHLLFNDVFKRIFSSLNVRQSLQHSHALAVFKL